MILNPMIIMLKKEFEYRNTYYTLVGKICDLDIVHEFLKIINTFKFNETFTQFIKDN